MIEYFSNSSNFTKGLFIMVIGIIGVFLVLIVFYFLIKFLTRIFPGKS